jgi:hypothetical protein
MTFYESMNINELVKSQKWDGKVKSPNARLANLEECGVLTVRRNDLPC